MLRQDYISGNAYFDTYYIRDTEKDKYIGIIENHCRGVKKQYFVGWNFKNKNYIPYITKYQPCKTETFDTYDEALNYIQMELEY